MPRAPAFEAPVGIGDVIEVRVDKIDDDGYGVGRLGTMFLIYIREARARGVKAGDTVKVIIDEVMPTHAVGWPRNR